MVNIGKKKKVLIALSGGIDSAVSAYLLLKQGCEVEAAFMKNWSSTEGLLKNECPWLTDRQDALRVAAFLRIPMHTLDFEKQYGDGVLKYFFSEYKKGRTPNPDVMCNKEIKFKLLYNWAMKNGFDYLATGHYARVGLRAKGKGLSETDLALSAKPYTLLRSSDEFKDQTYFIYNIKQNQLPHILFPIGGMKKSAVRSLARKVKLPNAEKKESMGLCFVGKIRLQDFLKQKLHEKPGSIVLVSPSLSLREDHRQFIKATRQPNTSVVNPFMGSSYDSTADKSDNYSSDKISSVKYKNTNADLTMTEKVIGQHQGLHNFTLGQRQGIKVGASGPYYVTRKDLKTNTLYVTNNPDDPALLTKEVQIHSINWTGEGLWAKGKGLSETNLALSAKPYTLLGRYRHQGELVPLNIEKTSRDHYHITFKHPQKAIASGQSLVLYKGRVCVGGGIIV